MHASEGGCSAHLKRLRLMFEWFAVIARLQRAHGVCAGCVRRQSQEQWSTRAWPMFTLNVHANVLPFFGSPSR